jgi:hypothetical protein
LEPGDIRDLENLGASLNKSNRQFEGALQASHPGVPNERKDEPDQSGSTPLEEYLASRLQQIGEVHPENKQIGAFRSGNGWDANQVVENVYKIEPISIKRAIQLALATKRNSKERLRTLFRRGNEGRAVVGTPTVEFIPIWKLSGFHECYYLRSTSYKINVKDDVVGVEVEGRSRDLLLQKKHRHLIPAVIVEKFQMLGAFLTSESKYFVVSDVLELATERTASELTISGTGKTINQDEEMMMTSWKSKRVFDPSELNVRGARVLVRESILNKEGVLHKFREHVVRMPEQFKQILSNKLQITEMKRTYIPFIKVPVQRGLVPHEVVINGASGQPADNRILQLLE